MTTPSFPSDILTLSKTEIVDWFKHKAIVAHPALVKTFDELSRLVKYGTNGRHIIFVYGPTGTGKTTCRKRLEVDLFKNNLPQMQINQSFIPVLSLEAASVDGIFNWKDFYHRGLEAALEPMIEKKINVKRLKPRKPVNINQQYRSSSADLKRVFENCVRQRLIKVLLIDEVNLLATQSSGLRHQMDCLKSLASLSHTICVLFGTYDMLPLKKQSDQLIRRTTGLHLPRYRPDKPDELQAFQDVLYSLQLMLPLREQPELTAWWDFMYERSAGCIGILKDWLADALTIAVDGERNTLTRLDLERSALPRDEMAKIVDEILRGEQIIRDEESMSEGELRRKLSLPCTSDTHEVMANDPSQAPDQLPRKRRRRPGQRNPSRDPVGLPVAS